MSGSADDLPVRVTEAHDLAVVEPLVNGVGGDGLVEKLGLAAARVAPSDGLGVRGAGGDPRARPLQQRVPSDVVGVPVRVLDQRELPGVRTHPLDGLPGVADEATVDERRCRPCTRSRLASGNGLRCQVNHVG